MPQEAFIQEGRGTVIVGKLANTGYAHSCPNITNHTQQPDYVQTHATQADTTPLPWATAAQWAQHRTTIERLYLKEYRTLREVMEIMMVQYGFRATDTTDGIITALMREVLGQKKPSGEPITPSGDVFVEPTVADFTTSMEMISNLLVKDEIDVAFSALRHIPGKIQRMLKEEPHHILHGFFHAIVKMNWDGEEARSMNSIMTAVLKYTAAFAADPALNWPPAHPLRRIFEGLTRLNTQVQLPEMAIRSWKYYMDNWELSPHAARAASYNTRPYATRPQSITLPRRHTTLDPPQYKDDSIFERLNINKDDIL
ncbi:hypothetical protein VMCG_08987 [Cytospora schulzeri]|uniref:Clr5 domain-containing protein n=1 Tax=Cytospora schulzeri TaxID=448051 RepID=A0A423VPQ4_9PEZI|nr:hypothetical protein VMCG_08987 [Valsa malicola]